VTNAWRSETVIGGRAAWRGEEDTRGYPVGVGPLRVSASLWDIAVRAGRNVDLIVILNPAQMPNLALTLFFSPWTGVDVFGIAIALSLGWEMKTHWANGCDPISSVVNSQTLLRDEVFQCTLDATGVRCCKVVGSDFVRKGPLMFKFRDWDPGAA
jgi:hypothetical protein